MSKQYWIKRGAKTNGPFSGTQLRKLVANGKIKANDEISVDQTKWVRAATVKGLNVQDSTKADTDTDGFGTEFDAALSDAVAWESAAEAVDVEDRPSVPLGPTLADAKHVGEDNDRYIELLAKSGKAVKSDLKSIRKRLLNGKLTRYSKARWVEPKPDRVDFNSAKECADAWKDWKARQQWQPIGTGLAKQSIRIRLLYSPVSACRDLGFMIVGVGVIGAVIIVTLLRYEESGLFGEWASATGVPSWFFALCGSFLVGIFVGLLVGWVVGGSVGALVGACAKPFLPKPPDDGYVASRDR